MHLPAVLPSSMFPPRMLQCCSARPQEFQTDCQGGLSWTHQRARDESCADAQAADMADPLEIEAARLHIIHTFPPGTYFTASNAKSPPKQQLASSPAPDATVDRASLAPAVQATEKVSNAGHVSCDRRLDAMHLN